MVRAMAHDADVLIAGGGMVGLTLGIALAGAGVRVAVVDPADPASLVDAGFDGRVSALAHGTWRMLETLGITPALTPLAQPILEIRVSDDASPLFLHYDHRELGEAPLGYIVENRHIRQALLAAATTWPELALIAPARLAEVAREGGRVGARLAGGRRLSAALVVAAEGRNSPLRAAAGIALTRSDYRQTAIVCTVAHARAHRGIAHERFLSAGPFAILPMTGNRSSLVWTERADLAPTMLALPEPEFAAEVAWRFGDFLGPLEVLPGLWRYPLRLQLAARTTDHRLALVGDAAHVIHPIAGQGLNLGLRDAAALAEVVVDAARLGEDLGAPEVLARYARWRRLDTLALATVTDALNRLFSNDIGPLALARDLGLAAVNRLPSLKRLFMRHAMGVVGDLPRLVAGQPL